MSLTIEARELVYPRPPLDAGRGRAGLLEQVDDAVKPDMIE